ncbi:MAG: PucR family transcriptional regulator, purine catabolism regulatory protein [Chloroflexota bacterium]|jgi:purine catabolism regulator|nr:PucR family transcriptional regulator, purine catabolism regulatory protein [Chloroflexota bacterium]
MGSKTPVAPPHPHVTVDDVWRGALPQGTQLVAGNAGTRREVVWCTTLRARQPAFTPLRGGELLLIDPQVLTAVDARLTLARLLESLAGQGVAGAAVLGRVSPEARRAAEAHALPLFALPAALPLDQVEQQVLRYIVDQRAELHERAQDLHRQLSELALAGRGLPALLARLHELTGVPVVLERDSGIDYVGAGRLADAAAALIAQERPALEEWLREVPLSAFDPPVALRPLAHGQTRLIAPILVQGSIAGFLSLLGSDGELGEMHRLAVGRAAHACAIELVRARAARDARDEVEEELLDVLTAGRPGTQQAARERAKRKGFDVDANYLVIAAEPAEPGLAPRIRAAWERQLGTMRLSALVRERGEATLALVSLAGRRAPDARSVVDHLHRAARASANTPVALGYGGVRSGANEVAAGAREAEQALSMGRRLFGPDSATAFNDLGLYRLLYALQPLPEMRAFRDDALARLRAKDRAGVLLQTLGAYLATNGSPTDAAERLHLHRNTVLYRLGRIEDLLGVDLRNAEVRLSLHLALKIGEVLEP